MTETPTAEPTEPETPTTEPETPTTEPETPTTEPEPDEGNGDDNGDDEE
jgi:hypothetical protein